MSDKSTPSPPGTPPKASNPALEQVKADDSKQARKRGREGSLEPSGSAADAQGVTPSGLTASSASGGVALPKKKNRTLSDRSAGASPDRTDKRTSIDEGSREKEIRQGVEGLGMTEQEKLKMGAVGTLKNGSIEPSTSASADQGDDTDEMRTHTPTPTTTPLESGLVPSTDPDDETVPDQSASMDDSKTTISTAATIDSNEDISISAVATPVGEFPPSISSASSAVGVEVPDKMDADDVLGAGVAAGLAGGAEKGLKRKHVVGSEHSALGRSESYLKESKKVKEDEPVASTSTLPPPAAKPVAKGFSSFAASSSPFVSRPPPSSGTSSPFGSAPPSASTSPTISSSATMPPPPTSSAAPTASKPNVPSFSAFSSSSGASPFSTGSKMTTSPSPFAGSNVFSSFASASPFKPSPAAGSSFGDILSTGGAKDSADKPDGEGATSANDAGESEEKDGAGESSASQLNSEDMLTGEEGEETRHQVRCKLHVMEKAGAWKERGTGLCKLNINTSTKVTRLVMRAEGVFRLILNIALFEGMSCERQDKWVRMIAFENRAVLHVALRFGTAKGAEDLFDAIQRLMPKPPKKLNYAMVGRGEDAADQDADKDGWGV